jgi:hypothetical protein
VKLKWIAISLLLLSWGCSSTKKPQHDMDMMQADDERPLQLQLAAKEFLRAHVPNPRGKTVLFLVDRSMDMDALDAYLGACATLGIYSTTIVLEARRDIDTPAHLLVAYQQDWIPKWIPAVASSFDQVLIGTYWNYDAFLPPPADSGKWDRLPYLTAKQLLSDQVHFPKNLRTILESSVAASLLKGQQAGIGISDAEGTKLTVQRYSSSGARMEKPILADGQIGVSIYQGLNAPMQISVQGGDIKEISGGGELGDTFRKIKGEKKLSLLEISFGLNPKAMLPKDFTGLEWSAWVSAWSSMNERSGTVRYKIGVESQEGLTWELANYYPTVTLGTEHLIDKGHLVALDSPAVTLALSEEEKKAEVLKEAWSPYPKTDNGPDQREGDDKKKTVAQVE